MRSLSDIYFHIRHMSGYSILDAIVETLGIAEERIKNNVYPERKQRMKEYNELSQEPELEPALKLCAEILGVQDDVQ
jgi:hypothetical protein